MVLEVPHVRVVIRELAKVVNPSLYYDELDSPKKIKLGGVALSQQISGTIFRNTIQASSSPLISPLPYNLIQSLGVSSNYQQIVTMV